MTDLRDAARQALEALEPMQNDRDDTAIQRTIAALKAALEQPEHGVTLKPVFYAPRRLSNEEVMAVIGPFRETEQEPVACPHRDEPRGCYRVRCQLGRKCVEPLYTHSPRREWRGLTEEDMIDIQDRCGVTILRDEFIAIEAKLKELNHD